MQKPILIIGTDSLAHEVAEILTTQGELVYGFLSDGDTQVTELGELPVVGSLTDRSSQGLLADERHSYVIAIEDSSQREQIYQAVFAATQKLPLTVVHPAASVSAGANLASGILVLAHAVLGAGVRLERLCLVRPGVVLDSGMSAEAGCTLGAGAVVGHNARLGAQVQLGAGAIVHASIQVADEALVAPGAVLLKSVHKGARMAGNPAQAL